MKLTKNIAALVLTSLTFFFGVTPHAEAARKNKLPEDLQPNSPTLQTEVKQLDAAFTLIHDGLWDYQGHRAKAQRQVQMAAKELGTLLRGDKRDKIPRSESDKKMNEAKTILQSVLSSLQSKGQTKAANHVTNAIKQIEAGLEAANK